MTYHIHTSASSYTLCLYTPPMLFSRSKIRISISGTPKYCLAWLRYLAVTRPDAPAPMMATFIDFMLRIVYR